LWGVQILWERVSRCKTLFRDLRPMNQMREGKNSFVKGGRNLEGEDQKSPEIKDGPTEGCSQAWNWRDLRDGKQFIDRGRALGNGGGPMAWCQEPDQTWAGTKSGGGVLYKCSGKYEGKEGYSTKEDFNSTMSGPSLGKSPLRRG